MRWASPPGSRAAAPCEARLSSTRTQPLHHTGSVHVQVEAVGTVVRGQEQHTGLPFACSTASGLGTPSPVQVRRQFRGLLPPDDRLEVEVLTGVEARA